jgi:hypothetical protein
MFRSNMLLSAIAMIWFATGLTTRASQFVEAPQYAARGGAAALVAGDFNGDGKPDLAADSTSNGISVLLGTATGFEAAVDYNTGFGPTGVAAADFNGDGKLDLVTANSGGRTMSVLLGNGDGTFRPRIDYWAGSGPSSIVVGDFNNDGKLDVAVTNVKGANISVLLGNGDGTFQTPLNSAKRGQLQMR